MKKNFFVLYRAKLFCPGFCSALERGVALTQWTCARNLFYHPY